MINHQVSQDHDQTLDTFTNAAGTLRLVVSRHGAEPVSIARKAADGSWTGFLIRDGDLSKKPDGWNNHSNLLGYFIHRLLNERSEYLGHEITGGTHSFLRQKEFSAPELTEDSATYHLSADKFAPSEYPFKVDFALTYRLTDEEIVTTFQFTSRENHDTHLSFGLHPGFAVTSLQTARVLLPAGRYIRHLAPGNFLSGETEIIDHPGGPMPFPVSELPGSFLLELSDIAERIIILEDPETFRRVTLDFAEVPYLTLWSDGPDYICIEPCWGMPDHHAQRPFETKAGIQVIPPLGKLSASFKIKPEFAS